MPFKLTGKELSRMHGNDERISVDNMKEGTRLMYEIVRKLAAD
jgi:acetylornithine deacetylase/succinyl-diaminopimelate desuccinylase-like protein